MIATHAPMAETDPVCEGLSYGTVRDYCESADRFPKLATQMQDLKDAQRPWAIKSLANLLPRGARLLEVGGGVPEAAAELVGLGYRVTVCDPFDGDGNGPTEFEKCRHYFPQVELVKASFTADWASRCRIPFDAVFSISVLEHIHSPELEDVFAGIRMVLRPGGVSLHAVDHILDGEGREGHEVQMAHILDGQAHVAGWTPPADWSTAAVERLMGAARDDLETCLLSAHGFNRWRGQTPYADYPFRKICSMQTVVRKG